MPELTTPRPDRLRRDPEAEVCLLTLAAGGDLAQIVDHLGSARPDWGYAKRLRYARKLVNAPDERTARAVIYATAPAAVTDQGLFRRGRTNEFRDLTGARAAHDLDVRDGLTAEVTG